MIFLSKNIKILYGRKQGNIIYKVTKGFGPPCFTRGGPLSKEFIVYIYPACRIIYHGQIYTLLHNSVRYIYASLYSAATAILLCLMIPISIAAKTASNISPPTKPAPTVPVVMSVPI